jgi:acetyltransferase
MVIVPPPPLESAGGIARALIPIIYAATKPVVIALMGERMIQEAVEYFRAARVPEYRFPERAAAALAVLVERAESVRARQADDEPANGTPLGRIDADHAHRLLVRHQRDAAHEGHDPGGFLPFEVVNELLAAYGIRVPRVALATTAAEAVDMAWQIGFPVALKIAAPDIVHKSEAGGVRLNLQDPDGVRRGFDEVLAAARAAAPEADILGVYVQQMILIGQEVIVGAVQDAQFGPLVMFGSGGVEVEGLRDVEFALAPVTPGEAEGLLARTWAGRRLAGFRNMPPADRAATLDVIRRLGQLAADFPQLAEIELNPVRVLPGDGGACAVDARARLAARERLDPPSD